MATMTDYDTDQIRPGKGFRQITNRRERYGWKAEVRKLTEQGFGEDGI